MRLRGLYLGEIVLICASLCKGSRKLAVCHQIKLHVLEDILAAELEGLELVPLIWRSDHLIGLTLGEES